MVASLGLTAGLMHAAQRTEHVPTVISGTICVSYSALRAQAGGFGGWAQAATPLAMVVHRVARRPQQRHTQRRHQVCPGPRDRSAIGARPEYVMGDAIKLCSHLNDVHSDAATRQRQHVGEQVSTHETYKILEGYISCAHAAARQMTSHHTNGMHSICLWDGQGGCRSRPKSRKRWRTAGDALKMRSSRGARVAIQNSTRAASGTCRIMGDTMRLTHC